MESIKQEYYKLSKKEIKSINEIDKTLPKNDNFNFRFDTNSSSLYDKKSLDKLIFRVGIMTSIISMSKNGTPMGIMITGYKNYLNADNLFIISSENGENLSIEEEKYYEDFININDIKESMELIFSKLKPEQGKCIVIVGIDNTSDSKKISEILIKGLKCIENCSFNLYTVIHSPCLSFITMLNQMAFQKIGLKYKMIFVPQDNCWAYLNHSFNKFHSYYNLVFKNKEEINNYEKELCIDCSNGIGGFYKNHIYNILCNKENNFPLKINFINDNNIKDNVNINNDINNNFGIKSILENKISKNIKGNFSSIIKNVCLSPNLDSLIYFINNKNNEIKIIKGEKMIILFCKMLNFLIDNFSKNLKIKYLEMIKMSIITSLYSNKAFISYCEKNLNNYQLCIVKTGIKNLEKESKKFDISVCYEYNGVGTIYINKELSKKFGKLSSLIETSKDSQIIELFQLFIALFNPTTSDGVTNLLIIESILKLMNLSIEDVYNFYEEIPYKMSDIRLKDKNKFVINNDESKLIEPKDVQNKIEEIINKYKNCRILLRYFDEYTLNVYVESENNEIIMKEVLYYLNEKKGIKYYYF